MSPPWMPFYVADYLADTGHLGAAEHGAYLLLIMHYWQQGGLPQDERQLARIARMSDREWGRAQELVAPFFDASWRHARIEAERRKAMDKTSRRIEAGRAGGYAKHQKDTRRDGERRDGERRDSTTTPFASPFASPLPAEATQRDAPSAMASSSQPQPDSSQSSEARRGREGQARQHGFDLFWQRYPHKVGKPAAEKAFAAMWRTGPRDVAPILAGLVRYIAAKPADRAWLNPATFLTQRRFEDEPSPPVASGGAAGLSRAVKRGPTMAEMAAMDQPVASEPPFREPAPFHEPVPFDERARFDDPVFHHTASHDTPSDETWRADGPDPDAGGSARPLPLASLADGGRRLVDR